MLMKYNLVHADCHGGNILVKIKEVPDSLVEQASEMFENLKNYAIAKAIKYGFSSEYLQKLSQEHYEYEMRIFGDA